MFPAASLAWPFRWTFCAGLIGLALTQASGRAEEIDESILAEVASHRELHAFIRLLEGLDRVVADGPMGDPDPDQVFPVRSAESTDEPLFIPLPWAAPPPSALSDAEAHRVFAQAWLDSEQQRFSAAASRLKALRDEHPLHPQANAEYLWALIQAGNFDQVAKALASLPEEALPRLDRLELDLYIKLTEGRLKELMEVADQTLKADPNSRIALYILAITCHTVDRNLALDACNKYLSLHTGRYPIIDRQIYQIRSGLQFERGRVPEGLFNATEAVRLGHEPVSLTSATWHSLMTLDRPAMARRVGARLKQLAPGSTASKRVQAIELFLDGQDDQSLLVLRSELDDPESTTGTLWTLLAAAMRSGDMDTVKRVEHAFLQNQNPRKYVAKVLTCYAMYRPHELEQQEQVWHDRVVDLSRHESKTWNLWTLTSLAAKRDWDQFDIYYAQFRSRLRVSSVDRFDHVRDLLVEHFQGRQAHDAALLGFQGAGVIFDPPDRVLDPNALTDSGPTRLQTEADNSNQQ